MNPNGPLVVVGIPALGWALALVCLAFALRAGRRQRLVESLPTSRTTGVFIGMVELRGTAEAEEPLVSALTRSRCVWHRWQVEESWSREVSETETDDAGRTRTRTRTENGWTTVAEGGEEAPFYLRDDSGVIRVQPSGAKVEPQTVLDVTCGPGDPLYFGKGPAREIADSDHRRRFVERAIQLHARTFVVGQARERQDVVAAEIAAAKGVPLFLISTRSPEQVTHGFRLGFLLLGALGAGLAAAGFVARNLALHLAAASDLVLLAVSGAGFLFLWLLGWTWMVYNSLVDIRQRVRQGWANVEVELERRHDLIPNLVSVVTGLRDYEHTVQTELAAMRSQLTATAPGRPGPDPAGCLPAVRAVGEAYPALKADASFLRLQQQLAEAEQRIALARSYFNEIATHYNTRLEVVPDRFVASIAGLKPQTLMGAAEFERAPVRVSLAT